MATVDIHAYGRVSRLDTTRPDDKSLTIQEQQFADACDTLIPQLFAGRQGKIIGVYKDEGKSASRKRIKRRDFDRLLKDIEAGQVKILMVLNLSRFSRLNHIDAMRLHMKLHDYNVKLVSIDDRKIVGIDDLMSFLEVAFKSNNDHEYARTVGRNTLRGCLHSVRQGQAHVKDIPYGMMKLYITERGDELRVRRGETLSKGKDWKVYLIPGDELEQQVVRQIFQQFADHDISPAYIARQLNESDNPLIRAGSSGKGWSEETVRNILKNRHYNGKVYYGVRATGEHIRSKRAEPVDAKELTAPDPLIVNSPYPAMIPDDLFNQVQKKFAHNKAANRRARVSNTGDGHPLTGILKCGCCGRSLQTYNLKHPRYQCKNRASECRWRSVSEDEMLGYILKSIDREILRQLKADTPNLPADDLDYRGRLADIDARITALQQALSTCSIDTIPAITAQIDSLNKQRGEVTSYIGAASQGERVRAAWERWEALVKPMLIGVRTNNIGDGNPLVESMGIDRIDIDRQFNYTYVKSSAIRQLLHSLDVQVRIDWSQGGQLEGGRVTATIDGAIRTTKVNQSC